MTQPTDDLTEWATTLLHDSVTCNGICRPAGHGRSLCEAGGIRLATALRSLRDSEPERFAALMGLERWGGWVTTDRCNHGDRDGCHLPHDYEPLYRIKGTQ